MDIGPFREELKKVGGEVHKASRWDGNETTVGQVLYEVISIKVPTTCMPTLKHL